MIGIFSRLFRLPDRSLLRDFFTLFSGSVLGQIILFAAGPVLSRLYSPEDFGLYAILSSIAGIASIISTGAYEFAIMNSRDEEEADSLLALPVTLSFIFFLVSLATISILLLFARPWQVPPYGWLWVLVPSYILFQGAINAAGYRLTLKGDYKSIARAKILRSTLMVAVQIGLGFAGFVWGLFPGVVAGHSLSATYQLRRVRDSLMRGLANISGKGWRPLAIHYRRFPQWLMPSQLINEASVHLPLYILGIYFTTAAVGLYALPWKFLSMPVLLIASSFGQVWYQRAAAARHNSEELTRITVSLSGFIFRTAVIPFSILLVFGDLLFVLFFGETWHESGRYAQMLAPMLLFNLTSTPIARIMIVLDRQHESMWFNTLLMGIRLATLLCGALVFGTPAAAILLFAAGGTLYYIALYIRSLALTGAPWPGITIRHLLMLIAVTLPLLLIRIYLLPAVAV